MSYVCTFLQIWLHIASCIASYMHAYFIPFALANNLCYNREPINLAQNVCFSTYLYFDYTKSHPVRSGSDLGQWVIWISDADLHDYNYSYRCLIIHKSLNCLWHLWDLLHKICIRTLLKRFYLHVKSVAIRYRGYHNKLFPCVLLNC